MPSRIAFWDHFYDVRRLMAEAGFGHDGCDLAVLTTDERDEQLLGFRAGISASDVAEQFVARRRLAMGNATVGA